MTIALRLMTIGVLCVCGSAVFAQSVDAPSVMVDAPPAQSAEAPPVRAPDNNLPANWPAATVLLAPSEPKPDGGETVYSWVGGAGMVEASRQTTDGIGKPLPEAPGRNGTVGPCRDAAWNDAAPLGARDVEASSAGPQTRERNGDVSAPVHLRLTYADPLKYEVKEGVVNCKVDRNGVVVGGTEEVAPK